MVAGRRPRVRRMPTGDLTASELGTIRDLLGRAFGGDDDGFTEADWDHAVGGMHFVLEVDGAIVGHASVVERVLEVGSRPLRTGYVEAVGIAPDRQGAGFGSQLMADVTAWIQERYELGALGTGRHRFYERLGWRTWSGPTSVRIAGGTQPTPEEDGYVLVLETPSSPSLDLTLPISCDWRPGDVW